MLYIHFPLLNPFNSSRYITEYYSNYLGGLRLCVLYIHIYNLNPWFYKRVSLNNFFNLLEVSIVRIPQTNKSGLTVEKGFVWEYETARRFNVCVAIPYTNASSCRWRSLMSLQTLVYTLWQQNHNFCSCLACWYIC